MNPSLHETFNRHQLRREQGIATVSVLAGPPVLGVRAWRDWAKVRGWGIAICGNPDREVVKHCWVSEWLRRTDPVDAAIQFIARRLGMDELELQSRILARSKAELLLFFNSSGLSESRAEAERLACQLITMDETNPQDWLLSNESLMLFSDDERPWIGLVASLLAFTPVRAPTLILSLSEDQAGNTSPDELDKTAEFLYGISFQVPKLPIAWALPEKRYLSYLAACKESRSKATCRETTVRIDSSGEDEILRVLGSLNFPDLESLEGSIKRIASDGADHSLIQSFIDAVKKRDVAASGEFAASELARSAAEAFLYERLDSMLETAGLFELNYQMDFLFGHRMMEVDLVSLRYKLAIEIDGYFHFVDNEKYRRDRKKDFLLQKEGYLVLRFLAEDIVTRLEEILDAILAALSLRRGNE
jgi:very-short-patch-repair endonuclease